MTKRDKFLPFHLPCIGREEIEEVTDTLRSGWLTTGPKTKRFEDMFKGYIGTKYALGLNSCTAGLHLSLVASGIGKGDEVVTSPITFPATANVILHQGAMPVFADVRPDNLNIDPDKIEELVTPHTKAIIPVHFAGHPCDMDSIMDIAKRHNLVVVEDAAHALESEYNGKKIGSIGDFTSFSFYATKNITTGEGGMLTTDNDKLIDKIRILSLHGISKDAWKRYGVEGFAHWENYYAGYKYNMFDIQAAIGLQQFKRIDMFLEKRKRYAAMYNDAFMDMPEIALLQEIGDIKHAHHLYVIIIRTEKLSAARDRILGEIQKNNIGVGVHFRALHKQPLYKEISGYNKYVLPNAEYASDRVISLPLYPKMTEYDVTDTIKAVKAGIQAFCKKYY